MACPKDTMPKAPNTKSKPMAEDRPDGRQGDQLDQRFRVEEGQQDAGRGQQQAEADVEQGESFMPVLAGAVETTVGASRGCRPQHEGHDVHSSFAGTRVQGTQLRRSMDAAIVPRMRSLFTQDHDDEASR